MRNLCREHNARVQIAIETRDRMIRDDPKFAALDLRLRLMDERRNRIDDLTYKLDSQACKAENDYRADRDDDGKAKAKKLQSRRQDCFRIMAEIRGRRYRLVERLNYLVNAEAQKNPAFQG